MYLAMRDTCIVDCYSYVFCAECVAQIVYALSTRVAQVSSSDESESSISIPPSIAATVEALRHRPTVVVKQATGAEDDGDMHSEDVRITNVVFCMVDVSKSSRYPVRESRLT